MEVRLKLIVQPKKTPSTNMKIIIIKEFQTTMETRLDNYVQENANRSLEESCKQLKEHIKSTYKAHNRTKNKDMETLIRKLNNWGYRRLKKFK